MAGVVGKGGRMMPQPMRTMLDYDSVTVICPCGDSISGEGIRIADFMDHHAKHTNGLCVETITVDGMRAYSEGDNAPQPHTYPLL